jgi:aminoglycoside 6-adenylyltransferase
MMTDKHAKLLDKIRQWAAANAEIRVMLLTSSLVNPVAPVDQYSDLDVEFAVRDLPAFLRDDSWLNNFGDIVAFTIENEDAFDGQYAMRMVFYEDFSKVDFRLYSVERFAEDAAKPELPEDWDVGYKVLLDKDGLTAGMLPPTYASTLPKKPSNAVFQTKMLDYWWDMECVAKCLCRDELFYAKYVSEVVMRFGNLQVMLEWYVGLEHDWQVTTNKYGKLFKKYLSPELWRKVEATFAGADMADNWRALFAYVELGSEIGPAIAKALGYAYPEELERKMRGRLEEMRDACYSKWAQ